MALGTPRTIDPDAVEITVGGQPLGDLWDEAPPETATFAGKIFHMSSDGYSSVGERVSVLAIEPGDRVRLRPHGPVITIAHVSWMLGSVALFGEGLRPHMFWAGADGWPTVERVIEERRPCD